MKFNLDEWQELQPIEFTLKGVTHYAERLSLPQAVHWQQELAKPLEGNTPEAREQFAADRMGRFFDAIGLPKDVFMALSVPAITRVVESFFLAHSKTS